jgi:hypothetical protein
VKRTFKIAKREDFECSLHKEMIPGYLVTHTYNPSYSGGRDQKNQGSKPPQANSSQDPMLKIPKKGWQSG